MASKLPAGLVNKKEDGPVEPETLAGRHRRQSHGDDFVDVGGGLQDQADLVKEPYLAVPCLDLMGQSLNLRSEPEQVFDHAGEEFRQRLKVCVRFLEIFPKPGTFQASGEESQPPVEPQSLVAGLKAGALIRINLLFLPAAGKAQEDTRLGNNN